MHPDVRHLLRTIGAPLRYRDPRARPRRSRVAFASIAVGGSARALLLPNLAAACRRRGLRVALVDGADELALADADECVIALRPADDRAPLEALLARIRPAWRRAAPWWVVCEFDAGRDPPPRDALVVHSDPAALFPSGSQAAADVAALARSLDAR
jgi:hypothetical protein